MTPFGGQVGLLHRTPGGIVRHYFRCYRITTTTAALVRYHLATYL